MKFNCGLSWSEKIKYWESWHSWFAWRPVRIGSRDCRWLETVERRWVWDKALARCIGANPWEVQYRSATSARVTAQDGAKS